MIRDVGQHCKAVALAKLHQAQNSSYLQHIASVWSSLSDSSLNINTCDWMKRFGDYWEHTSHLYPVNIDSAVRDELRRISIDADDLIAAYQPR
jgi:hypothetical protein